MRTPARLRWVLLWLVASVGAPLAAQTPQRIAPTCTRAVVEGEVRAGQSFEKVFSPGLRFILESIQSGWIVRVVEDGKPREAHDYAELATPPYRSVTPLAVSTDFSFRAQDAVGWNPRRFRYAADPGAFAAMRALYDPALAGDPTSMSRLASLAARQPEAELVITDAHMAPGTNDQVPMAAAVASHFEATPHSVETRGASALGKLTALRFRATFTLERGKRAAAGVQTESIPCADIVKHPTPRQGAASQTVRPPSK